MADPESTVLLREVDGRGRIKNELPLGHKPPIGTEVLTEIVSIPNFSAKAEIRVFRADEPLSTPAEEGDYADGGLLIVSRGVVLLLSFFKFEYND
jgi:hypothetical protein